MSSLGPAARSGKALKKATRAPAWKAQSYASGRKTRSTADLKSKISITVNDAIDDVVVHQRWTNPDARDFHEQAKLIESNFNNALSSQGVAWLDHDLNELAKFVSLKVSL